MDNAALLDNRLRLHAAEHRAMRAGGLARMTMDRRQQLNMRNWFAYDMGVSRGTAGIDPRSWPTWAKWTAGAAVVAIPLAVLLYMES